MAQRNIHYPGPMIGLEIDQREGGQPCVLYSNIANFPQPNIQTTILPSQANRAITELRGPLFYGAHHHHPPLSHMYVNPSSSQVFPVPIGHRPHDQLPFYVDGLGGDAFKRKNSEGLLGNFQGGSSSSAGLLSAQPLESDVAHRIQGNHVGQSYQTAGVPWMNQAPALPYLHGFMNGGSTEISNICTQRTRFMHPPPPTIPQGIHNIHHMVPPPPPMHGVHGQNTEFHSQGATSASIRFPTNGSASQASMNHFQDGVLEVGPRFLGPVLPNGPRMYPPRRRREMMLDVMLRQRRLSHLRVLPEDGVGVPDISSYHEVGGDSVDRHRDMRLDIDHMSYEELLALGELIGSVNSGLSEEIICRDLKTRAFVVSPSTSCSHHEKAQLSCVICQGEYEEGEKMGVLNCGHEYHVDCIKKWLLVKNICPICKSAALSSAEKDSQEGK